MQMIAAKVVVLDVSDRFTEKIPFLVKIFSSG
jgi:hypothetical protein